ncbi:MAG: hypothetical protein ACRERD_12855, partial [Candidatus Binatia bacterium]
QWPTQTRAHPGCEHLASPPPAAAAWYSLTSSVGPGEPHLSFPAARWSGRYSPLPHRSGPAPTLAARARPPRRQRPQAEPDIGNRISAAPGRVIRASDNAEVPL